jgi:hypothetical protein
VRAQLCDGAAAATHCTLTDTHGSEATRDGVGRASGGIDGCTYSCGVAICSS